jgi:bifunctional DNA-binding transcriptional regulator/antitoxin component of YhaV-PrlF toxin-antitoxin module
VEKGAFNMPLTESVTFKTKLQRHNRIVVPRLLRWRYKMETGELLKANVRVFGSENYEEETFLAKMTSDGRLTIPKLTMDVLNQREQKNLTGCILEVTINPASQSNGTLPPESAETKMLDKIKGIRKNLGSTIS